MAKSKNRGRTISQLTKYILCAKAAGRCQFKGCNKNLFEDKVTCSTFNNTNFAHIIASSPDGPRGDELLSHKLSDDIDNIMLLCPEHHKLIDTDVDAYPVAYLKAMKTEHENSIVKLCDQVSLSESTIIRVVSPIKGSQEVTIDYKEAVDAISGRYIPSDGKGIYMSLNSGYEYKSTEYWTEMETVIQRKYETLIAARLDETPNMMFSVFPLAPIPLIAKLGYLMGDKVSATIFQKKRSPATWAWMQQQERNKFSYNYYENCEGEGIALILSISAELNTADVLDVCNARHVFTITAEQKNVDAILSEADLAAFWHVYQHVLDKITHDIGMKTHIAVFPAIPVSAAFEIGRRYMPKVYPVLDIYDNDNGFFKTIEIGG